MNKIAKAWLFHIFTRSRKEASAACVRLATQLDEATVAAGTTKKHYPDINQSFSSALCDVHAYRGGIQCSAKH